MERDKTPKSIEAILAGLDDGVPEGIGYNPTTEASLADLRAMRAASKPLYCAEATAMATRNLANAAFLRMNVYDHATLGSGVPEEFVKHGDGAPCVDSMNDDEVLEYLVNLKEVLVEKLPLPGGLEIIANFKIVRTLRLDIEYLRSIGRLPDEFKDFDVREYAKSLLTSS